MERETLDAFRAGQRDALERIYRENFCQTVTLVRSALRRAGHYSDANVADLVQEIFAKAFASKARAQYDGEREYGPYLAQLARNMVVDWLRVKRREISVASDSVILHEIPHAINEVEAPLFSPRLMAVTRRFVTELGPDLRAVHEHRFLAAKSQVRAAEALGLSRQQLRTLERRLLARLRRQLRDAAFAELAGEVARRGATYRDGDAVNVDDWSVAHGAHPLGAPCRAQSSRPSARRAPTVRASS